MKNIELINDHFQNYKRYWIPKAQLVIADIPYNLWNKAYASNPAWYNDWDNKKGESDKAWKQFFDTDKDFNLKEYFHFCNKLLKPEPKEKWKASCMIIFCSFEQQFDIIRLWKEYWFPNYINLVFRKNFSSQVLKANMKVVWNCEYAILLYRDKLPKFNNNGKMVMNCFDWVRDTKTEHIHPTQKPVTLLQDLIQLFTDEWEVVIDPCAWSWSTLLASAMCNRKAYWFEIKKKFVKDANEKLFKHIETKLF